MNALRTHSDRIKKQLGKARTPLLFVLLVLQSCSEQDKQDAIEAAPKTFELNLHFPIPVEPWPLPSE